MLAALTRVPELQLSDEEAAKLGEGAANVMRHYDVGPQTQKAVDWTNLFMVLGMIYGTRFVAVKHRRASEKSAAPDNVIHLHGQPTG